ncbi:O-antigen ligase domain-containing protein [Corallococcus sp. CA041A]|uniref:exopolysaccharide repeat unit polymerase n=1 Tax=Corallococcus sp. CA041A TaxID=2316727 RepID=UPI000EA3B089|nr:exopolysaccharide repeat unit polymerase [Corallococcus sp. CA041A]RKH21346.1 O-antigen ligase domain-containing protein [Corallococcus sp. CA041A]
MAFKPSPAAWLQYIVMVVGLGAVTLGAAAVGNGDPIVTLAPVLALTVGWVIIKVPLRYLAITVLYLVLAVDYTPERPQSMFWPSPLFPLGKLLFTQMHELVGIGALRFPLIDGLIIGAIVIGICRRAAKSKIDPPVVPIPRPLAVVLAISFFSIMWMEVWGIARGGDIKNSLWQWHQAAVLPLVGMMYHYSLRGPEDWPLVAKTIIAAALTKSAVSTYFALVIIPAQHLEVEYTTCHSDSMTFIFAISVCIMRWLERPRSGHAIRGLIIIILVFIGMFFNDRRLAYVSLVGGLAAAYLFNPWTPLKKFITRGLIACSPLLVVYFLAGWSSSSSIFKPVATFRSIIEGQHAEGELDYRDIENLNLIATWNTNPVFGTGYGHEFLEPYPLPNIAFVFPTYRFHPHNSLLGLLAFGGWFGFTGVWMYLVVTVYLAARAYHRAYAAEHRTACLVIVGVVASYLNQVFGDMGIISYICTFQVAVCSVLAGKLAMVTGAWPWPQREKVLGLTRAAPDEAPPSGATAA